jgi:hypothetical protein
VSCPRAGSRHKAEPPAPYDVAAGEAAAVAAAEAVGADSVATEAASRRRAVSI